MAYVLPTTLSCYDIQEQDFTGIQEVGYVVDSSLNPSNPKFVLVEKKSYKTLTPFKYHSDQMYIPTEH